MRRVFSTIFSPKTLVMVLGFTITFAIVALPELAAIINTSGDFVWSPFHSGNFRMGDSYYYWPIVMEVLEGTFFIQSTSVTSPTGQYGIQLLNLTAAAVGAAPGLLLEDPRWIYFISFFGLFSSYFIVGFYFAHKYTKNLLGSILVAVLFVWYFDFFQVIEFHKFNFAMLKLVFTRFDYFAEFDLLNGRLRYLNTNATALITLIFIFAIINLKEQPKFSSLVFCSLAGIVVAFSYPPQAFMAYEFLIITFLYSILKREFRASKRLGTSLLIIGIALIALRFPQIYRDAHANSPFVGIIFQNKPNFSLRGIYEYFASNDSIKTTLIFGIWSWLTMFLVTKGQAQFRFWVVVLGACFSINILAVVTNANPYLIDRLFYRGILVFWPLFLFTFTVQALLRSVSLNKFSANYGLCHPIRALTCLLIFGLLYFPARGSIQFTSRLAQKGFRPHQLTYMEWETYEWIRKHIPTNDVILTVDWNDIFIIPMIAHANLYFGHWLLNNRPLSEEMTKFITARKLLDSAESSLPKALRTSCADYDEWISAQSKPWAELQFPFTNDPIFQNAMVPFGIFYWPYIRTTAHGEICNPNGEIGSSLTAKVMELYNSVNIPKELTSVKWIMTNPTADVERLERLLGEKIEVVFQNSFKKILKRPQASIIN